MAIIPQVSMFVWSEIEELGDLERLRLVMEYMPDESFMRKLEDERGKGRDDYPVRAVWNTILAGVVFQHISIESLRRELSRNGQLRFMCGLYGAGDKAVPTEWVYTRFLKKLFKHEEEINKIKEKYNHKKIVFFVGRHVPYKGIDYLIESDKYITEDCMILIGGTGEQSASLKELAKDHPRIKFIGRLSNNEVKYYLHASDVFAFPSINRSEAFGVALAEALYCGLPAVSFYIDGSGTMWVNQNNKTGLVVENKNVEKYGEAISILLGNEILRKQMSENAKEWARQNFLPNQILPIIEKVYF